MSHATARPLSEDVKRFYGIDGALYGVTLHEPPATHQIPEALIHDLWSTQQFDPFSLTTTSGEPITLLHPGEPNDDAGPDFLGARLLIGTLEWHGDIEIHTHSRFWFDHEHHVDPRYNSTILHVALYADLWTGGLLRPDGSLLPEVILSPHLTTPIRSLLYTFLTQPDQSIPCAGSWSQVPDTIRTNYLLHLGEERLLQKTEALATRYLSVPDVESLLHQRLFAGLGYAKNSEAMLDLARRIPLGLARSLDPTDLEALHFGVAGLLPATATCETLDTATATYCRDLKHRYDRLQQRLEIPEMERSSWRFFRMRPPNFPTLRIAQGVALLVTGRLLSHDPVGKLLDALAHPDPLSTLRQHLRVSPSVFWETHLRLTHTTKARKRPLGLQRIDTLLINAVMPILLLVSGQQQRPGLREQLHSLFHGLPPQQDEITREYEKLGTRPRHVLEAQGLHQLYRTRCQKFKCLNCAIGRFLLDSA